jgi:aryl-alcohol dehydrogenase-like predicted oxidoreductase
LKLGIGTAQFGLDYGLSNTSGQTSLKEVRSILKVATKNGVDVLDTAYFYGDSESVIGRCLPEQNRFRIITKTPSFKKNRYSADDGNIIKKAFCESLKRLKLSSVAGLLIQDAYNVLAEGGEFLYEGMLELKYKGLVEKIGFSVYNGEQIDKLLDLYDFELIQVPVNVLDQRLIKGGELKKLKNKDIEIHARSIFLQGLLLMEPDNLHSFFDPIKPVINKYRSFVISRGLTPVEGAINFVASVPEIDYIIVGVNTATQLRANLDGFKSTLKDRMPLENFSMFSLEESRYINPSLWKLN